jgi:hypothetical protein
MMMKTLKVKLCLLIVLAAIMVPAISIPAQAEGTNEEKFKISGELGYQNDIITGFDPSKLYFSASATTLHKEYDEIRLEIAYGIPIRSNNKDKCNFNSFGEVDLTKSEMDAKGQIRLRLTDLSAKKAQCIRINVTINSIHTVYNNGIWAIQRFPIDVDSRLILWDPNKQYDNWLAYGSVISIGYDKGDTNYIRFHGIGKASIPNDATDGSLDDTYYDTTKALGEIVEWSSTKKFPSKTKKYKLFVDSITSYYDSDEGKKKTSYSTFTLFWKPNLSIFDYKPLGDLQLVDVPLKPNN